MRTRFFWGLLLGLAASAVLNLALYAQAENQRRRAEQAEGWLDDARRREKKLEEVIRWYADDRAAVRNGKSP